MSNRNIHQITDFSHLKRMVSENLTVIIGFMCPISSKNEKVMVKKFLKRKSELFPLVQFVYMELTDEQIKTTKLDIIDRDPDMYPMIYHIRDGNKVLCEVKAADNDSIYESFDQVAPYYKAEMEEFAKSVEQKKTTKGKTPQSVKKPKIAVNIGTPDAQKSQKSQKSQKNLKNKQNKLADSSANRMNDDSESEIEIEKAENDGTEGSPDNADNGDNNGEVDPSKKSLDPELKAAIEREKLLAIEKAYEKIQEKLFEEMKNRIRLEQKDIDEEKERSKKAKSKDAKDKNDTKNQKKPSPSQNYKQNDKPQRDQIGSSSKSNAKAPPARRRR